MELGRQNKQNNILWLNLFEESLNIRISQKGINFPVPAEG